MWTFVQVRRTTTFLAALLGATIVTRAKLYHNSYRTEFQLRHWWWWWWQAKLLFMLNLYLHTVCTHFSTFGSSTFGFLNVSINVISHQLFTQLHTAVQHTSYPNLPQTRSHCTYNKTSPHVNEARCVDNFIVLYIYHTYVSYMLVWPTKKVCVVCAWLYFLYSFSLAAQTARADCEHKKVKPR